MCFGDFLSKTAIQRKQLLKYIGGLKSSHQNLQLFLQSKVTFDLIEQNNFKSNITLGELGPALREVVSSIEYEAQTRGFKVIILTDLQVRCDNPNPSILLDWNLYKIQLFHCVQSEVVSKTNSNNIVI